MAEKNIVPHPFEGGNLKKGCTYCGELPSHLAHSSGYDMRDVIHERNGWLNTEVSRLGERIAELEHELANTSRDYSELRDSFDKHRENELRLEADILRKDRTIIALNEEYRELRDRTLDEH